MFDGTEIMYYFDTSGQWKPHVIYHIKPWPKGNIKICINHRVMSIDIILWQVQKLISLCSQWLQIHNITLACIILWLIALEFRQSTLLCTTVYMQDLLVFDWEDLVILLWMQVLLNYTVRCLMQFLKVSTELVNIYKSTSRVRIQCLAGSIMPAKKVFRRCQRHNMSEMPPKFCSQGE